MKKLIVTILICSLGTGLSIAQGVDNNLGTANNGSFTGGFTWIGDSGGFHLSLDNNEVQSRFGTAANTLFLNYWGGDIDLLGSSNMTGDLKVDGSGLFYDNSSDRVGIGESLPDSKLHVTATTPEVLKLESNSQTTLDFYTGSTLQYRIRKLGSGTGDFQFRNENSSYTNWIQNFSMAMTLSPTGYLGIGSGTDAIADTRLHVTGDNDESLYDFEVEDNQFAFMQFDASLQSGIAFRNGSTTNANAWYRGNGNAGLIFNTVSSGATIHLFIEDDTGNVGVGDETPDAIFDVEGDTDGCNFGSRTGGGHGYVNTQKPVGSTNTVVQRWRDGIATQVTINNDADTYQMEVFGSALASGGTWTNSDAKLKENINTLGEGTLDKVLKLNPTSYTFKRSPEYGFLRLSEEPQIGFIAQELEQEFPQIVNTTIQTDADGETVVDHELKSVNYEALVPVLTKAIQEQQALIQQQQTLIESLDARLKALEK
ncbi:MAG: tail fiber domain-containing protein [Saprospiraceae bacterium]|nr:tail fiber domain-containing protein [Bacteroidia bacterium]NNE16533.1 tail fiber domain-containing protein [Saprospiraceae bacterium]NNL92064.1 tail fiber domain-containing protein [Saprospiraceae bacterium]